MVEGELDLDAYEGYLETGTGSRVVELQGLCDAICQRCVCREYGGWPVEVREDLHRQEGLVTYPYLFCTSCGGKDYISYSSVTRSSSTSSDKRQRQAALNKRSELATKCVVCCVMFMLCVLFVLCAVFLLCVGLNPAMTSTWCPMVTVGTCQLANIAGLLL